MCHYMRVSTPDLYAFICQPVHPSNHLCFTEMIKIVLFTACRWCSSGKLIRCRCDYRRRQKMGSGWSNWFPNIRFCYRTRYGGGKGDNDNDDAIIMMMRGCKKEHYGKQVRGGEEKCYAIDLLPCVHKSMCSMICIGFSLIPRLS